MSFSADEHAPVYASATIEIAAPVDEVWKLITGVTSWPEWNPDVRHAVLDGPLAAGSSFTWKAGPGTIRSVFRSVEPMRQVGWTGKTLGIPARHVYYLEGAGECTRVTSQESWDGALAQALRRPLQRTLQKAVRSGLEALKRRAEHLATPRAA